MQRDALRDARAYLRWLGRMGMVIPRAEVQAKLDEMQENTDNHGQPRTKEAGRQLSRLAQVVAACRKCEIGHTRKNSVFGVGNPAAALVFVGEAPGAREDETGKPFVGPAGNLLTQELARHGVTRDEVFICNVLKCHPPNDRDPVADEIIACESYLLQQLDIIQPKMLCALGRFAAATLLKCPIFIMKLRGSWQSYGGRPLFMCLHPAAVLHSPANRSLFSSDIEALARAYHAAKGGPGAPDIRTNR